MSNHAGDFYCLHCVYTFRILNQLESHKKTCKNNDFFLSVKSSDDIKTLEFNQYQKTDKAPSVIYENLKSLIKK